MIPFELAAIFVLLQDANTRLEGAARLASYSGAARVLVFAKDAEIGCFLPAAGLPQTLREGARWQTFLSRWQRDGHAVLPDPDSGADVAAHGIRDAGANAVLVFLGDEPSGVVAGEVAALLPLLGARLALERRMLVAEGHAQAAREASRRAGSLNEALDISRRELQAAYHKAEYELCTRRAAEHKLMEADRRKDEFLAMLAHELRNPLAPIAVAAQVLKGAPSQASMTQICTVIERQVNHMSRLLDDLLDVSRVAGGLVTLARELLDMRAIVDEALEQARPLIERRAHRLSVTLPGQPVLVNGDPTRLVQIVTNLLNNAAKYTLPGGMIDVQLAVSGNEIVLTVGDSGIGIEARLLPYVFDLFTQGARSADRTEGGLGLGLALVKNLAERHGGRVQAASDGAGQGSTFELTLPQAGDAGYSKAIATDDVDTSGAALSILIVDDNDDAAEMLGMFLETLGHHVATAGNGTMGLDAARRTSPRVLLLDIGLPDMDGWDLATRLRQLPQVQDSVFIALTGYGHLEHRERSRAAGFDHHLVKPVAFQELTSLLGRVGHPGPRPGP